MNAEAIGKKLVELRGKKTQAEVAGDLGITQAALSFYELGKRIPSDEMKVKIAGYYKIGVDRLFYSS